MQGNKLRLQRYIKCSSEFSKWKPVTVSETNTTLGYVTMGQHAFCDFLNRGVLWQIVCHSENDPSQRQYHMQGKIVISLWLFSATTNFCEHSELKISTQNKLRHCMRMQMCLFIIRFILGEHILNTPKLMQWNSMKRFTQNTCSTLKIKLQ
jgi:hypothetical protein